MRRRGPVEVILLSIVTCGLYLFYWIYTMSDDINRQIGDATEMSAGTELVLCIVTCGIYTIYWFYKYSKKLMQLASIRGTYTTDNAIVTLILAVFGFQIVSAAILQHQFNQITFSNVQ